MRQDPRFPMRALAVAAMFALAVPAMAQSSNATLRGSVAATGKAVGGAEITATNTASGYVTRTRSNANGSYALVGLPPGTYRIVADAGGQRTEQVVTLAVGQSADLDLAVGAAGAAPEAAAVTTLTAVTVTGTQLVDRKTSEVGTYVSPQQLQRLPQVTRNFLSQADLAPGVNVEYDAEGNVKVRSGAAARGSVNVFIDGVGQKDYVLRGGTTGQDNSRGNPFPQSAIGEYKITTQNYKAEFDQVSSAAISAATKSGTNEFHGDAFVDHTASNLRAATPAERAAGTKSDTSQQQFGVSVGGPIIRDALHFFVAYEGKENRDPKAVVPIGPTVAAPLLPASARSLLGAVTSPFHEDLVFAKLDWALDDANRFDFSVKVRQEKDRKHVGGSETSEFASDNKIDEKRFDLKHTYSSDFFVNEARLTYENVHFSQDPLSTANGVRYRYLVGPSTAGTYDEQGVLDAGGNNFYQRKGQKGYSFQNDFTYTGLASHVIKVGAKVKQVTVDSLELSNSTPQFFYDLGAPDPTTPFRAEFGKPLAGVGNGTLKSKNTQFGIYLQDDWEVNKNLTLNLGVRYDFERSPGYLNYQTPADAVAALNTQDPRAPAGQTYAQTLALGGVNVGDYISTGGNRKSFSGGIQPRLGFSYDLGGDKQYVLFGGAGRSYDRNVFDILQLEATKGTYPSYGVGFKSPGSRGNCQVPAAGTDCVAWNAAYFDPATLRTLGTSGGGRELNLLKNDLKTPYSDQFSLGFRSGIGAWNTTVTLSHIEQKDGFVFLLGNRLPNGAFYAAGTTSGPPFGAGVPGQGSLILGSNGINTKVDSLQLQADKPYTKASGWGVTAAYTFSHAKENHNSQDDFTYLLDYPTASASPYLRSSVVPRHKLVSTATYDLPWGVISSAKLTLATPKVIRDFNCSASGCVADTVQKKSFRQVDFSVGKSFAVGNGFTVGVRLDVINAFDYRNYSDYLVDWTTHTATPNETGNLDGPPRTIKLGLNASW
jgi:outer membrane receptor protein involved in Fe transport